MFALALTACGGGGSAASTGTSTGTTGSTGSTTGSTTSAGPTYTAGVYPPASTYVAQCAAPRTTGTDPSTGRPWPDRAGSALTEKYWLRSWTNDLYLWYSEVPDSDPALTPAVLDYFALLKTPLTNPSGTPKDKPAFHFTYPTDQWIALSTAGNSVGYGISWKIVSSTPPRRAVVKYVESSSPAGTAGIARGMELQSVDGVDLVNDNTSTGVATLNAALSPTATGQSHSFVFRTLSGTTLAATIASANVVENPVPTTGVINGNVGYLLFNDHIATAEAKLVDAITTLRNQTVADLVLDLRYNGGGYLDLASELAYMIGGPRVSGKTFEQVQFNARYPSSNPVIGGAITPTPFWTTSQGFSIASGQALPTLNLSRVIVLTSAQTCSASEAIINGLIGAGVQVVQVGANTCGKPYGFYPQDNCGTTYFSIEFRGVNAVGFGDYPDGFSANRTIGDARSNLPGCAVADDFTHALGDPAETQLATALGFLRNAACASTISGAEAPASGPRAAGTTAETEGGAISLPPEDWRTNRILRRP